MATVEAVVDVEDKVGLEFQDIPHDSYEDKGDTHRFSDFPPSANDDDPSTDKSQLLEEGEKKTPSSFWTFEYYQTFFDVDTNQVLQRILGSMLPLPNRNYLQTRIRPNPDLYGPFWICATLVFTTAIAGNLANYFNTPPTESYQWNYEFHKVSYAATAIYSYWWLVPTAVWAVLRWRGSLAGYTYLEVICVYGYSLAIYVPISIFWVINLPVLQWILVMVGMLLSGTVLVLTFWPAVKNDNRKVAILLVSMIVLLHGALAVGFVLYFFHYPTNASVVADIKTTTLDPRVLSGLRRQSKLMQTRALTQNTLHS